VVGGWVEVVGVVVGGWRWWVGGGDGWVEVVGGWRWGVGGGVGGGGAAGGGWGGGSWGAPRGAQKSGCPSCPDWESY